MAIRNFSTANQTYCMLMAMGLFILYLKARQEKRQPKPPSKDSNLNLGIIIEHTKPLLPIHLIVKKTI